MILSSKDNIDMFLIHLTASFLSSANEHIPYGKFNSHIKPYWKKSELHNANYEMRQSRRAWKSEGSPRDKHNESYVNYKKKCKWKLHRLAKKDWTQTIFDEIDKAAEIDIGTFYIWKNKKKNKHSTTFQFKI